jgi:hypothetical protein
MKKRLPGHPPFLSTISPTRAAVDVADRVATGHGVAKRTGDALYRGTLREFLRDLDQRTLIPTLTSRFSEVYYSAVSAAERASWEASLPALAEVLRDQRFERGVVFVELRMPLCARRADVVLTGRAADGNPSTVVIELKQWESVRKSALPEDVAVGSSSRQHPSAQARDYVSFLRHYHSAFSDGGCMLSGCAFLHAMSERSSMALLRDPVIFGSMPTDHPIFFQRESRLLATWLAERLCGGDGAAAADAIENGVVRPSEKLLDMVVQAIQGTFEWKLLDEQRRAFIIILTAVEIARASGEKTVVIVRGGPGTGKSVLAVQLLAHAAAKHWRVTHATGSQALQINLQARTMDFVDGLMKRVYNVKYKKQLPVERMFCTFADVARVDTENALDLVVADEAHRLWDFRKTEFRGYLKLLSDVPMAEEIMRASRVCAFFLDDNQSVRAGEIGRSSVLKAHAARLGIKVVEVDLNIQFRCNGSESYVHWVDHLLGFERDNDLQWLRFGGYDFVLAHSMPEMVASLERHRLLGERCRLIAGYCWKWSDPIGSSLVDDVDDPRFGGWKGPWIERTEQSRSPQENRYYRWATNESVAHQVGSIYSAQGFEFDRVGVIWGEDLVWRSDRWVANMKKNQDGVFKRAVTKAKADPVEKLRSVYRVLLTRGMRGTSLFVLDDETREQVSSLLALPRIAAAAG